MGYREKARERFRGRCCRCGEEAEWSEVEVHHVDRDRSNESLDNLEPVCKECHNNEHHGGQLWGLVVKVPRPMLDAVDNAVEAEGYSSRSEAVNRALAEAFGEHADDTWMGGPRQSVEAWFGRAGSEPPGERAVRPPHADRGDQND